MARGPRWLKRREFLSYYALHRILGRRCANLGEIIDVLAPLLGGKRAASRMARMLARLGLLRRCAPLSYEPVDLREYLDRLLLLYLAGRLRRRGLEAAYDEARDVLAVKAVDQELCYKLEAVTRPLGARLDCKGETSES